VIILLSRKEQKERTRLTILNKTEELIFKNGLSKLSTRKISELCNVSQGTIFLHFSSKHNLIKAVLSSNIRNLNNDLNRRLKPKLDKDEFLKNFINVIFDNEEFLSIIYRDMAYLFEDIKKDIIDLENNMKNLFFQNLKFNRSTDISIIDSFLLIDSFLSFVKVNLQERNPSTVSSIIKQKRGRIVKLYKILFYS
jgi:AcrR family transcriptional regulator